MSERVVSKFGLLFSSGISLAFLLTLYLASKSDPNAQADILRQIANTPNTEEFNPHLAEQLETIIEQTPEILQQLPTREKALQIAGQGDTAV